MKTLKILIIRFSSIGDIVLTSPVARCLKQQLNAEIHFLTKKGFRFIAEQNPYIEKTFGLEQKNKKDDWQALIPLLKAEKYDYVIDLHKNLRSWYVRWKLGAKSYAFPKLNFKKWLLVNFKINRLPNVHIVDRYLATTKALGVKNDEQGLDYFIPEKDSVDLNSSYPSIAQQPYIALVIGAAHSTKRMPNSKIIELCNQLPLPVVLLGGPGDLENAQQIEQNSQPQQLLLNLCGKLNLNQSADMLRQAHTVISHDTGLMHIAAAFKKRIISIWGNTVPDFGMYPYLPKNQTESTIIEVKNLSCRPCSKIGSKTCPKGHFKCMNDISIEAILKSKSIR